MTLLAPAADFAYGNTRLRARRRQRLSGAELLDLAARDLDGLYGGLSATAYRVEVEAALARGGGTPRLHEAIRAHQAAELTALRSFYRGRARELVDLLLAGYDLQNLVAILRAALRGGDTAGAAASEIVPVGAFTAAIVRELGRRHEPVAVVELLLAWKLPDAVTARAAAHAYERFERDGDLPQVEHEVAAVHTDRTAERLERLGDAARPLQAVLARRVDERNLVAGLRLRAVLDERPDRRLDASWLPGGAAGVDALDDAIRRPSAADAAEALASALPGAARPALAAWARDGDLVALERALDNRRVLDELALFHRGDPLGIEIPIAACAELDLEARNLRVLAEGAALDLGPDELRGRLLLASP